MKVLVTGDKGYIGAVLLGKLIEADYDIVGLDTGFFEQDLIFDDAGPIYKKITKDIRKVKLPDIKGIDAVIHLSALSNDPMGEINSKLTEDINHKASIHLARLAKKSGVKKFIFSSSCSIYGIAKNGVVDESSKVNPLTAYAKSKVKTEKALQKMASEDFEVFILRNATVYGFSPRFRNDLVVNNLVTTAIAYGQIRIMSDGTPWRPLIDVRDLASILIEFLKIKNKSLNGRVVNIGFNENNFQVKDIVDKIKKVLPDCRVVYTGEHGSDTRSYRVNFDKFKSIFPKVKQEWTLDKSIKDLVEKLVKINFGKKEFESGIFTRLVVLKQLMKENKVNKQLFWRR